MLIQQHTPWSGVAPALQDLCVFRTRDEHTLCKSLKGCEVWRCGDRSGAFIISAPETQHPQWGGPSVEQGMKSLKPWAGLHTCPAEQGEPPGSRPVYFLTWAAEPLPAWQGTNLSQY